MANSKKPANEPKRVNDVSHPDESTPSATSKPVIVTNRPILKDPMVVEKGDEEESENTDNKIDLSKAQAPVIKPLESSEQNEAAEQLEKTAEDNRVPGIEAPEPDEVSSEPALPEEQADERIAEEVAAPVPDREDEADVRQAETASDDLNSETAGDTAPAPAGEAETATSDESKPDTTDTPPPSGPPSPDAKKKEEEAELAAKAKHEAAVQKLIDSKKYQLPIKTEENRSPQNRIVIIVGIVLLALLWLDVSLDAGIVHLGGLHSLTHFFSN